MPTRTTACSSCSSTRITSPTLPRGTTRVSAGPGARADSRPREKKPLGARGIDKAIVNFLERAIGPGDLVAAMSPEMDADRMVFSRRPERFAEWVGTAWARRFSWDDLEPEEERWGVCYPPDEVGDPYGCYTGIFEEMVLRHHEMQTLQAIEDTVARLGVLREGRKAVLLISEGWAIYRPNQRLARALPRVSTQGCPPTPPPLPGDLRGAGREAADWDGSEEPAESSIPTRATRRASAWRCRTTRATIGGCSTARTAKR